MKTKKWRFVSGLLAVIFLFNLVDKQILSFFFHQLKAYAAASDYAIGFSWDISGLGENDHVNRTYELTADNTNLYLKEMEDESPVLKTTFSFNLARAIEPGNLSFTITGLNDLIRNGTLDLNRNDPNIVGTWDILKNDENDTYTFTNKVRVTSNNETTFTWQFDSRKGINGADIDLITECSVIEQKVVTTTITDPETGEETTTTEIVKTPPISLDPNDLHFHYESEVDENQVKIVCKLLEETDFNNLNGDYDWRDYYSMLGLAGLKEMTKQNNGTEYTGENQIEDAHWIIQTGALQEENKHARGIKTADYFIEVDKNDLAEDEILIVDATGSPVSLGSYTMADGTTHYGFYVFQGAGDRKPGESYACDYRVGILNDALRGTTKEITLTGLYIVTYNDENTPRVYSDTAKHTAQLDSPQPVGNGNYMLKYNNYEINYGITYNGHHYSSHARHWSGVNQLLFDTIFSGNNGGIVTYNLSARTPRIEIKQTDGTTGTETIQIPDYDLIYEDSAPSITNLSTFDDDHNWTGYLTDSEKNVENGTKVLTYNEYDFKRLKVRKLVKGDTVTPTFSGTGFDFDIYVKTNDPFPQNTDFTDWKKIDNSGAIITEGHTGNTGNDSEIFLPDGIDEIKLVVCDLNIRADVSAYVDIEYNVDKTLIDNVYIDTEHLYENNNAEDGNVTETTNHGTKLVNEFTRKQLNGDYHVGNDYETSTSYEEGKIVEQTHNTVHSNTWLRDSVTTIDATAKIEPFNYHELADAGSSNYYTTTITAGGTIQSDTQKALNTFVVYSKIPENITLCDDWLEEFRNSLTFSSVLLASGETVDAQYILDNDFLTVYYDEEKECIVAEFDCSGSALDSNAFTSVSFSYPAQITVNAFNSLKVDTQWFETDTYVTVTDNNVRLSAKQGKSLLASSDATNPTNKDAAKASDKKAISALGSQKSNYTTKHVQSFYNKWVFDGSTEVDGNNTEHLDSVTGRMTSEYSYKMTFHRISSVTGEQVIDPVMIDIVDGLKDSVWHGRIETITIREDELPSGYTPEVYYYLRKNENKSNSNGDMYHYTYPVIDNSIAAFTNYGGENEDKTGELELYHELIQEITAENNWIVSDGVKNNGIYTFSIGQNDVYAVAVLFRGYHAIDKINDANEMDLIAYLNMRAPDIVNDSNDTNNNRAAYNDVHAFAKGKDGMSTGEYPLYSLSNKTMVILRHNIELLKVSSTNNDKRLTGATFDVFDSDGETLVQYYKKNAANPTPMHNMSVNLSGILQMNLAPGIYYYQETKAPSGYELDPQKYRFRAISDENAVYYYTAELKEPAELENQHLIVNFKEFERYETTIYDDKEPVDSSVVFHVYNNSNTPMGYLKYDDTENRFVYNISDSASQPEDISLSCDSDGVVEIFNLPAGSYTIGTTLDDPDKYSFSVADNSSAKFKIFKKSILTSNVSYTLKKMSGIELSALDTLLWFTKDSQGAYTICSEEAAGATTVLTPAPDGQLIINGLSDNDSYYFENTTAPLGYKKSVIQFVNVNQLSDTSKIKTDNAIITENGKLTLSAAEQLLKTSRLVVEDDPIDKASVNFQKIDGTIINGMKAQKYGTPLNQATYNMYYIEEDGTRTLLYFSLNSQTGHYTLVGSAGAPGYTTNLTSREADVKNEDTVTKINGMLTVHNLVYGSYELVEITPPNAYTLNENKTYFYVMPSTIDENGWLKFTDETDSQKTTNISYLKDSEVLSSLEFKKQDGNGNYLSNAAYDIYLLNPKPADSEITDDEYLAAAENASWTSLGRTNSAAFKQYWVKPDLEEEQPPYYARIFTNSTGEATLDNLPFGTYLIYEYLAPVGYQWNNDSEKWETWLYKDGKNTTDNIHSQIVVIQQETVWKNSSLSKVRTAVQDTNGKQPGEDGWTETYEYVDSIKYHPFYAEHIDERKTGSARLIKRNQEQDGLYDGTFALYQVNLTDSELANLLGNDITEQQVAAMTDNQRQQAIDQIELKITDIDIANHYNAATGKLNSIQVLGNSTTDIAINQDLKTNGDVTTPGATQTVQGLEWGIYYFYEIQAPAGYQKDKTPYVFAVNSSNAGTTTIDVNVADDKVYGEVWLYKQAKDTIPETQNDHLKLFGAQFELYTNHHEKISAVPMLRYDKTKAQLPVSNIEIISNTEIKITLKDNSIITITYNLNKTGTISNITTDNSFQAAHGTLIPSDFRIAYYIISSDKTKFYDPELNQYRELVTELGDNPTADETAKFQKDADIISCITTTYITINEGGRLNVRGLDWASYYFHETVPPEGYGLADDVIFTVNAYNCDNQLLGCEDPTAKAAIIIDKEIPNTEYFTAYGEPTFMFRIYSLTPFTPEDETNNLTPDYIKNNIKYKKNGEEYTLPIHLSDPDIIGSAIVNVPVGQYLIEELPVSRYACYGLELVPGTNGTDDKFKSAGASTPTSYLIYNNSTKYDINTTEGSHQWTAFCDLTGGDNTFPEIVAFHVKYKNKIERYDNFSQVTYVDNRIPERVYVTAFKPNYTTILPVKTGDSALYQLNLKNALENKEFEAWLSYNNGESEKLTADKLKNIRFDIPKGAVTNITWNWNTGDFEFSVREPASLAGQSIKFDVGYAEGLTSYNTDNTDMVKGTLYLTFGEVKMDRVKKLILKNDVQNKSFFLWTDTTSTPPIETKESSVSVLYTKSATTGKITQKNLHNTDTIITMSGYKFLYWYLLDADGRPLTDINGDIIQFADESEIRAYMFEGTWPSYLTADGKNLIPDTFANPASVENVNSFTFQAEVVEVKAPQAKLMEGPTVHKYLDNIANSSGNHSRIKEIKISDTPPWENGHTNYILPTQSNLNSTQYMAISVTYPKAVSADGTFTEYEEYDADYPNVIYAWCEWNNGASTYAIRWYTDDPVGIMANENSSDLFREMNSLYDVDVTSIMNTSLVTDAKYMFYMKNNATALKSLDLTNWDLSNVTDMSYMFYGLKGLKSISFDSSFEKCTTTEQMFAQSIVLCDISFSDKTNFSSLENVNKMFDNTARLGYNTDSNGNPTAYNKTKLIDILTSMKLGKTKLFQSGLPDNNRCLIWINTSGGKITNGADSLVVFSGGDGNMYEIGGNSGSNDEKCRLRLHS